jgi:hypothetical protein
LYSYEAGTTTPQPTYTTAAGNIAHTNPIILNSAGRVATGEIWLTAGQNYKFVLTTSTDVTIATWDNITGINGTGIASNAVNVQYDPAGLGAVATTVQAKLRETVSVKDFGAVGNGVTDDRNALMTAMAQSVSLGKTLYVPDGVYACSNWMPLPSGLKMVFAPGAVWKLTATTGPIGGFVIGGYDLALNVLPFDDVEIHGITLDCNSIPGENGFNAVKANNVRLINPKIYNTVYSPTRLGGRAFQFEGYFVDGIHIYSPYIENCSIGINSQGQPAGASVSRNINYYDVVMRDVNIPFNVDSQFASPQTNTLLTMSTFVHGVELFNCGKITWPGNSGSTEGGIICGDRGYGLKISGFRLINESAYGGIGAIVRGVMFNVHLSDAQIQIPSATAIFDFTVLGFGSPSQETFESTVFADGVSFVGNLDFVVKGGSSNDRIGASRFSGIEINASAATLTGIVDINAGTGTSGTSGYLELILSDQQFKTSFLRPFGSIYSNGNTTGVCQPDYDEGSWTPIDASGASLSFTVAGVSRWVRVGRLIIANCRIQYPSTTSTSNATIGGLPFVSGNFGGTGGVGAIGYTSEPTLNAVYVLNNTSTATLSTSAGALVQNSVMSGDSVDLTFTYIA